MQAKKMADPVTEMFIWSKLGENLLEMEVRRFARIKKAIWDQLLATKAEIIQRKLYYRFACTFPKVTMAGLQCHAIKNKNHNHTMNLAKNLGCDR